MKRYFGVLILMGLSLFWMPHAQSQSPTPNFQVIQTIQRGPFSYFRYAEIEQTGFSPDGSLIAAPVDRETFNIWHVASGHVIHSHEFSTSQIVWSPDGRLIAAGAKNANLIGIWNASTGDFVRNLEGVSACRWISGIAWSPDSTRIVTTCWEILDVQTSNLVAELDPTWSSPNQLAWSPDGSMIAAAGGHDHRFIQLFFADGSRFDTYWGDVSIAWSPDSTRLASTGQIRTISTGLPVTIIPDMQDRFAWHPDGDWIVSTDYGSDIHLWDVHSGELVTTWHFDGCRIGGFIWNADGNRFAFTCTQSEPIYKTELVIGELIR